MVLHRSDTSIEDAKVVTGRTKKEMTGQDLSVTPLTHKQAIIQAAGGGDTKSGKKDKKKSAAKRRK